MEFWIFLGNIYSALGMGLLIGLEREFRQHPASLRTNALVCVGSALFMALTPLINDEIKGGDPTRIAHGIITGIGFLGGGVILKQGLNIRGLNTAATLWCTAAVGTLCGAGYWNLGLAGTVTILLVHFIFRPISDWISHLGKYSEQDFSFSITVVSTSESDSSIRIALNKFLDSNPKLSLGSILTTKLGDLREFEIVAKIFSPTNQKDAIDSFLNTLNKESGVRVVRWEKDPRFTD